jgi:hypothetical protein
VRRRARVSVFGSPSTRGRSARRPLRWSSLPRTGPVIVRALAVRRPTHQRLRHSDLVQHLAPSAPRKLVGVVEQIERGQRLRRDRPRVVDHSQQHGLIDLAVIVGRAIDVKSIELLLQGRKGVLWHVCVQAPAQIFGGADQVVPAEFRCSADACTHERCVALDRLAQTLGQLAHYQRRTPPQPRREIGQSLAACKPCAGAGELFSTFEQAQAALRERLVAAGQPDQRPGVARTERGPARAAGRQPALDACAQDPHGSSRSSVSAAATRSPERSFIHARAIAPEQPRGVSDADRRIVIGEGQTDTVEGRFLRLCLNSH